MSPNVSLCIKHITIYPIIMIVGGNQHLDLEYYLSCTIGTVTNSELGLEKQVVLMKISNSVQLIGHKHL